MGARRRVIDDKVEVSCGPFSWADFPHVIVADASACGEKVVRPLPSRGPVLVKRRYHGVVNVKDGILTITAEHSENQDQ
ncbi:MAG TPA: hypothetical protein IAA15_07985, partial [Candidatus Olsenella pullicola]|nr:hypothetical protein [Candidatus Olsenella pullicola]